MAIEESLEFGVREFGVVAAMIDLEKKCPTKNILMQSSHCMYRIIWQVQTHFEL